MDSKLKYSSWKTDIYKEWMITDYPKNVYYKPEGRRNIGRPQTRSKVDFREEGAGQGA